MQNKYKVSTWRNGQPAIFTDRGLVCLMEAGNQLTREKDAAEIVAILNAAPDLLAELRGMVCLYEVMHARNPYTDSRPLQALAAIAKAEGGK